MTHPSFRSAVIAIACVLVGASPVWSGTASTRRERQAAETGTPSLLLIDRAHEAYFRGRDAEVERLTRGPAAQSDPDLLYLRSLALDALGRGAEADQAAARLSRMTSPREHPRRSRSYSETPPGERSVHVGTFAHKNNAESLAQRLAAAHWSSYLEETADRRLWRVLVGPFVDETSAKQAERQLRLEGHPARVQRG